MIKHKLLSPASFFSSGPLDLGLHINRPLDVGYCTILICDSGTATIAYSFIKYKLKAGNIFVMFGDVSAIPFDVSDDFSAFMLAMSDQMAEMLPCKDFHDLFYFLHQHPLLIPTAEQRKLLVSWRQMVSWASRSENALSDKRLLLNAVSSFFIGVESKIKRKYALNQRSAEDRRASNTANRLLKLILEHIRENRDLSFYADKLNVTIGYLNKVMQREFHKTPKKVIDHLVLAELKALLTTTDLSIKEIAIEMNFEDPSYLNRFFRLNTGISMTKFRSEIHSK